MRLRDTLKGAVASAEKQHGGPVVGKVLGKSTARASALGDEIVRRRVHGRVERVSAHNLVQMRRGNGARVDERVESIDHQLRTAESHHGHGALAGATLHGDEGQGEDFPKHLWRWGKKRVGDDGGGGQGSNPNLYFTPRDIHPGKRKKRKLLVPTSPANAILDKKKKKREGRLISNNMASI